MAKKNFVNKLFLANNKKKRRKVNPPLIQNN